MSQFAVGKPLLHPPLADFCVFKILLSFGLWIHVSDGFISEMDSCQGWIHVRDGFMSGMDSCQKDPAVVYHSQFPEGAGDRVQATGCRRILQLERDP